LNTQKKKTAYVDEKIREYQRNGWLDDLPLAHSAPPPANPDAEQAMLASFVLDDGEGLIFKNCLESGMDVSYFFTPEHQIIFETIREIYDAKKTIEQIAICETAHTNGKLEAMGGAPLLSLVCNRIQTTLGWENWLEILRAKALQRTIMRGALVIRENAQTEANPSEILKQVEKLASEISKRNIDKIGLFAKILQQQTNVLKEPHRPAPIVNFNGQTFLKCGDLGLIVGRAKTGKSGVLCAIQAALFAGARNAGIDTLGFTAPNPDGKAVLRVDTEQNHEDAWDFQRRALRCARITPESAPPWFSQFEFSGDSPEDIIRKIEILLEEKSKQHGGIKLLIIDGAADLLYSVNDEETALILYNRLRKLAQKYNCAILSVIHSNEGEEADKTARGHLGKTFIRKCESVFYVEREKETEISIVWPYRMRRAACGKDNGVKFKWDTREAMHMSIKNDCNIKSFAEKTEENKAESQEAFVLLLHRIFETKITMKHGAIISKIMDIKTTTRAGARTYLNRLKTKCLISELSQGDWKANFPPVASRDRCATGAQQVGATGAQQAGGWEGYTYPSHPTAAANEIEPEA
jgi:hypothetical protein